MSGGRALRIDETRAGLAFWIHVSPRARRVRVGGLHGDALAVAVRAPPVEGKANAACVRALAEALSIRRADVSLALSSRGRRKRVEIVGDPDALRQRLHSLASEA